MVTTTIPRPPTSITLFQRSKSDKHEGTIKSTIREVSPPQKSERSISPEKDRGGSKDDKDWSSTKQADRSVYSDYEQRASSASPPRRRSSPSPDYPSTRNQSPPPPQPQSASAVHKFKFRSIGSSSYEQSTGDKYFSGTGEETEKRSVIIPKDEEFSRAEYRQRRYRPTCNKCV